MALLANIKYDLWITSRLLQIVPRWKNQPFKLIKSCGLDLNVSCQTDNEESGVPSRKSLVFIQTWSMLGQIVYY